MSLKYFVICCIFTSGCGFAITAIFFIQKLEKIGVRVTRVQVRIRVSARFRVNGGYLP